MLFSAPFQLIVKQFSKAHPSPPCNMVRHGLIRHRLINLTPVGVAKNPILGSGLSHGFKHIVDKNRFKISTGLLEPGVLCGTGRRNPGLRMYVGYCIHILVIGHWSLKNVSVIRVRVRAPILPFPEKQPKIHIPTRSEACAKSAFPVLYSTFRNPHLNNFQLCLKRPGGLYGLKNGNQVSW